MKNETKTLILMAIYVAVLARYIQSTATFILSYFGVSWVFMLTATLASVAIAYILTELVVRRWKASLIAKTIVLLGFVLLPIILLRIVMHITST